MANSTIANLSGYDPTSLQNTTSLSMFASHNGNNRFVDLAIMAGILGNPVHSQKRQTIVQTLDILGEVILFDEILTDPWGACDVNSPGIITAPFNCVAEIAYSYRTSASGINAFYLNVNSNFREGLTYNYGFYSTPAEGCYRTGPVFLNSGDYIELKWGTGNNNYTASFGYYWISFIPLRMYIDTDWKI